MRPAPLASFAPLVALLITCVASGRAGADPVAAPKAERKITFVPIELAALAEQSKTVELPEELLRAALIKGKPEAVGFSAALDLGGGTAAVAWSECTQKACRGFAALLAGAPAQPRLVKKVSLVAPARLFFLDGLTFEPPALADLDGDGAPELVLRYRTTEPPRRALGSVVREHVAVHDPGDLAVLFSHELRRAGADSEEACEWKLCRHDAQLVLNGKCNQRACLEATPPAAGCKPDRARFEVWSKPAGRKRFQRTSP
jgi:hypothetical protein